jgi:hypothetical protein
MEKVCFEITCEHLCNHVHTHSYFRKLSPRELRQEEESLGLQPCPDCALKPFSEWDSKVIKKRGGVSSWSWKTNCFRTRGNNHHKNTPEVHSHVNICLDKGVHLKYPYYMKYVIPWGYYL